MIHHVWSVLCEQILTNPKTGNVSHINTIHDILLKKDIKKGEERTAGPFVLTTKWLSDAHKEETIQLRITAEGPDKNEPRFKTTTEIKFDEDAFVIAMNMDFVSFPVKTVGLHIIKIEHKTPASKKWKVAAKLPLAVVVGKKDQSSF